MCIPSYLNLKGRPEHAQHLPFHQQLLSGPRTNTRSWTLRGEDGAEFTVPARPFFLCDNASALRGAALADLGITFLPNSLVERDTDAGRLEDLLPTYSTPEFPICVIYPSRRHL